MFKVKVIYLDDKDNVIEGEAIVASVLSQSYEPANIGTPIYLYDENKEEIGVVPRCVAILPIEKK